MKKRYLLPYFILLIYFLTNVFSINCDDLYSTNSDIIFCDGFESGDLSSTNSDGFQWDGPNKVSIVTQNPDDGPVAVYNGNPINNPHDSTMPDGSIRDWNAKNGDYSMRFKYDPGVAWTEQRFSMGGVGYEDLWVSYWIRVPHNYVRKSGPNNQNNKWFLMTMADRKDPYYGQGNISAFFVSDWPGGNGDDFANFNLQIRNGKTGQYTPTGNSYVDFMGTNDRGKWMHVVYQLESPTTSSSNDGVIRMYRKWENEQEYEVIKELTGLDEFVSAAGTQGWGWGYLMGWANVPYEVQTEFLLDDIIFSTSSLLDIEDGSNGGENLDQVTYPNWNLEVIADNLDKAYPGINYETKISVIGGKYPYNFELVNPPSGMTINDKEGIINWDAPTNSQTNLVNVKITDANNNIIFHEYNLEVTTNGFYFLSPSGSDSLSNLGNINQPWNSIEYVQSNAPADSIIYFRDGDYIINNQFNIYSNNPNKWIAYPNENPSIDFSLNYIYYHNNNLGIIQGLEIYNCGTYCFKLYNSNNLLIYKNNFHDLIQLNSCNQCNPSFLFIAGNDETNTLHNEVSISNNNFIDFDNSQGTADTAGAIISFNIDKLLVDNNFFSNFPRYGVVDKVSTYKNTYRNNIFENTNSAAISVKGVKNADNILIHNNIIKDDGLQICEGNTCSNIYIFENTIYNNKFKLGSRNSGALTPYLINVNIMNNILVQSDGSTPIYDLYPIVYDDVFTGEAINTNNNLIFMPNNDRISKKIDGGYINLNSWQSNGHDTSSLFTDPLLDSNYIPQDGSPVCGSGLNGEDIGAIKCGGGVDPPQDNNPPTKPTLNEVSKTSDSITLSWGESSDASPPITYTLYKDGSPLTPTQGLSYEVEGLEPGTIYSFYLRAEDSRGNGINSNSISITTEEESNNDFEWVFFDDFEGSVDNTFWLGEGVYVNYSITDTTDSSNKVMEMRYVPNSEPDGDSWTEYDFLLGVNAKQVLMEFDLYVPSNYVSFSNNHKIFALWSGIYGKTNAQISVSSEYWGDTLVPSVYVGVDKLNYGHYSHPFDKPLWKGNEGKWVDMKIYLELADFEGDYGKMDLYMNDELITSTHYPTLNDDHWSGAPDPPNIIDYASTGNYIDQGTILGWANDETGGIPETQRFLVDNFIISANTEINYNVNGSGNSSGGGTDPPEDILPPTPAPEITLDSKSTNSISISWSESVDSQSPPVTYKVYNGNTLEETKTTRTHTFTNLIQNTEYNLRIDAEDSNGNSISSNIFNVRTDAVIISPGKNIITLYPTEDTYLNQDNNNFNNEIFLNTYTWGDYNIANVILMKFDLSSIPSDANIKSSTLELYQFESGREDSLYDISAYRIINNNPIFSEVSGNEYSLGNPWSAVSGRTSPLALGDISSPSDTSTLNLIDNEYKSWDILDIVSYWYTNPNENYGLLLDSDASSVKDNFRSFRSIEHIDSSQWPKLTITYDIGDISVDPVCGNFIKELNEVCDEGINPSQNCEYGESNCQVCTGSCTYTSGNVIGYCGDGIVQSTDGEDCDGIVGLLMCSEVNLGYDIGDVSCTSSCSYDYISCSSTGPDDKAPMISNILPTEGNLAVGTTSVITSFTTLQSATCKYSSNRTFDYETDGTPFNDYISIHNTTLNNLTIGNYKYYIKCKDLVGNINSDDEANFITFSIPELVVTPPDNGGDTGGKSRGGGSSRSSDKPSLIDSSKDVCVPDYNALSWSTCLNGEQRRLVLDDNSCVDEKTETRKCSFKNTEIENKFLNAKKLDVQKSENKKRTYNTQLTASYNEIFKTDKKLEDESFVLVDGESGEEYLGKLVEENNGEFFYSLERIDESNLADLKFEGLVPQTISENVDSGFRSLFGSPIFITIVSVVSILLMLGFIIYLVIYIRKVHE